MLSSSIVLETTRLILRHIQPSDFDNLLRMNSDPEVMKYVGDGSIRNHQQMLNEINLLMSYYSKRPGPGVWAIALKESANFIGAGGLTYNVDKAATEIGYRFLPEHWNKKYATEVASGLLKYAFKKLQVDKVIASAHCDNTGSRRVMEKKWNDTFGEGVEFNCSQAYYEIVKQAYSIV